MRRKAIVSLDKFPVGGDLSFNYEVSSEKNCSQRVLRPSLLNLSSVSFKLNKISPSSLICPPLLAAHSHPVANTKDILQACIYKSVKTGQFLKSFMATKVV